MLLNRVLHNRFTCMLKYGHQTITFIWKNLTFYSSLFNFFFLKFRIIKFMKMSVNNPKDEYLISQHIVLIQQYISSRLWIKIRNLQVFFLSLLPSAVHFSQCMLLGASRCPSYMTTFVSIKVHQIQTTITVKKIPIA